MNNFNNWLQKKSEEDAGIRNQVEKINNGLGEAGLEDLISLLSMHSNRRRVTRILGLLPEHLLKRLRHHFFDSTMGTDFEDKF